MFHCVLHIRFPELILWVSGAQSDGRNSDKTLEAECHEAFVNLSKPPSSDLSILWVEQVLRFSPMESVVSLVGMVSTITAQHLWPVVEHRLLEVHANAMLEMMLQHLQLVTWGGSRTPVSSNEVLSFGFLDPSTSVLHTNLWAFFSSFVDGCLRDPDRCHSTQK
jgi:hypothetical protein